MKKIISPFAALLYASIFIGIAGCSSTLSNQSTQVLPDEKDRQAILAMAGNYEVTFDFTETVSFAAEYEKKEPYVTGAHEVVRVIADQPGFISLQHILIVGTDKPFPIKHWRQDWIYQPTSVHEFVGFNSWQKRTLADNERIGKWAQVVYQVDDSPRYAGIAAWHHENGISQWTSEASLRPLPRRDMTKRDDYHAILASNRHAITPTGWVHEQDNSKLILRPQGPELLVREIGVNRYVHNDDFAFNVADDYWQATEAYWQGVRDKWSQLDEQHAQYELTVQGEPTPLYMPLLEYAGYVKEGKMPLNEAIENALQTIEQFTTNELSDFPRVDYSTMVNYQ
ncbi:MAG: hypothetical protein Alis3KO_06120 [Aliiglaciecola sp.]